MTQQSRSWVITLPQNVDWNSYMRTEVMPAADCSVALNYRVHGVPRDLRAGDRCYIVWRRRVRGWMEVTDVKHWPDGFPCLATGTHWPPGTYIQRSGLFHPVGGPEMIGFRGIRRYDPPADPSPLPPGPLYL